MLELCNGSSAETVSLGCHNDRRTSYGQSMIVDAWGTIGEHCSELTFISYCCIYNTKCAVAELPKYKPLSSSIREDDNANSSVMYDADVTASMILPVDEAFENSICYYAFNRENLRKIRSGLPVEDHHRYELFPK